MGDLNNLVSALEQLDGQLPQVPQVIEGLEADSKNFPQNLLALGGQVHATRAQMNNPLEQINALLILEVEKILKTSDLNITNIELDWESIPPSISFKIPIDKDMPIPQPPASKGKKKMDPLQTRI